MFQEDYSTEQHHYGENYYGDNLCVAEDILFLINTDGSRRLRLGSPSREPYQTISTVYFILSTLRTGLWSQGRKVYEVVLD